MAFYAKYGIRTQDKDGGKLRFKAGNKVEGVDPELMKVLKNDGHVEEQKEEQQKQTQGEQKAS